MALEQSVTMEYESGAVIQVENSYTRVDSYSGTKDTTTIYVNTYLSKQNFEEGNACLGPTKILSFAHSVDDNAPNTIKQGYLFLKTLPEFSDAIDV